MGITGELDVLSILKGDTTPFPVTPLLHNILMLEIWAVLLLYFYCSFLQSLQKARLFPPNVKMRSSVATITVVVCLSEALSRNRGRCACPSVLEAR